MLEVHKTKEGHQMVISSMENDHLIKTVKMFLKRIDESKHNLSVNVGNTFQAALYDVDYAEVVRKSKHQIQNFTKLLYPYVTECMLRGLDVSVEMQNTFERVERDNCVANTSLMLAAPDYDDYDEDGDCPF